MKGDNLVRFPREADNAESGFDIKIGGQTIRITTSAKVVFGGDDANEPGGKVVEFPPNGKQAGRDVTRAVPRAKRSNKK